MEIHLRVSFFVQRGDDRHKFCERNYRIRRCYPDDDLHSLAHEYFDRLRRQYNQDVPNLDDLTKCGFGFKILTNGRDEPVPPEDVDLNFVDFVIKYEVEGGKITPKLVVGAEQYFVENASTELHGQQDFPNPAHR